ncbi:MAG: hypothetical protein R3B47_18700 [Bacteroidia bacterium]
MKFQATIFISGLLALALLAACKSTKTLSYKAGSCDRLAVDLDQGTLNGLNGAASMDEVKKQLPCFTGETEEGSSFNCGGGLFYLDHDFYFYTHRNYIEIRKDFKGTMSQDMLGKSMSELGGAFSKPDKEKEYESTFSGTVTNYYEYRKKWGTLVIVIEDEAVIEVALHFGKEPGDVEYCL